MRSALLPSITIGSCGRIQREKYVKEGEPRGEEEKKREGEGEGEGEGEEEEEREGEEEEEREGEEEEEERKERGRQGCTHSHPYSWQRFSA